MGIGTILFSEYAGATHFSFGSNLTDSIWHLMEKPPLAVNATSPLPFRELGIKQVCLTNGLGGAAILRLVTHYFPDGLHETFDSLALPGTQKRYHKELILQCVEKRFGTTIQYTPTGMRDTSKFGEIIETDLQLPYMLQHLDRKTLESFVSDIPQEIYDMAQNRQLTFYERFYPTFLQTVPKELQSYFLDRLREAGIQQYTQQDYEDMLALSDFAWKRYRK